jgi:ATP-binding cassette subfamily F protein 3
MLDEPTNHLDMHSCDLLIDALSKYAGSIILVSHDRYFISKTANKIWEIVDHEIKEFKGGYEEWVDWKERMAKAKSLESAPAAKDIVAKSQPSQAGQKIIKKKAEPEQTATIEPQSLNNASDRDAKKELQRLQRKFQQVEEQVTKTNQKKVELEKALGEPDTYSNQQKFTETENAYKTVTMELARLNSEYETLFEKIVSLES